MSVDHQPGVYSMVNAAYDTEAVTTQPTITDLSAGDSAAPNRSFRIVIQVEGRPRIHLELLDNSVDDPDY